MLKRLFRKRDPKAGLRAVLGDAKLPTFPDVVMRALQLLRQDVSLSNVANVLCSDPGVSAKLLSMVNSSAHALRRPVKDVPQAATLLGRARIEETLLGVAVAGALPNTPAAGFDPKRFWRDAAWRAAAARSLAKVLHPGTASASYTAGLLQDMAIPLVAHSVGNYADVLGRWREERTCLATLEREAFDWDHAEVAGWMCNEWSFPDLLTSAIVTHHHDGDDAGQDVPAAVRLVSCLGDPDDQAGIDSLIETAERAYGMAPDDTETHLQASLEEASEIAKLFAA